MDSYPTDSSRWTALQAHDPLADGSFVYCVKTTGIYCRPTCGARLARRANVIFHDDASTAEGAGFRACKRCKPDLEKHDPQVSLIARARHTIEKARNDKTTVPSLADLAEEAGLTKSHFHRVFKKITGVTPKIYADGLIKDSTTDAKTTTSSETPSLADLASSEGPVTPMLPQVTRVLDGSTSHKPEFSLATTSYLGHHSGLNGNNLVNDLYAVSSGLSPDEVVLLPKPVPKEIIYTIQPWGSSFVLIATSPNGVCLLDIEESSGDLLKALVARFPGSKLSPSLWSFETSLRPAEPQDSQHRIFESIMNALVNPTGKMLDIQFDLHL